MKDEDTAAKAEGEALPESTQPAKAGFFVRAEQTALSIEQRAVAAIEDWYERHFHACAVSGRAPLSADDKAALVKGVADAVAPATKE